MDIVLLQQTLKEGKVEGERGRRKGEEGEEKERRRGERKEGEEEGGDDM